MESALATEEVIINAVQWLRLVVEAMAAIMVGIGCLLALIRFVRTLATGQTRDFNAIRLLLARYLALGLEFQLGADILSTTVAPSWDQIGKLAAVAVIRTGLNYFLSKEMEKEKASLKTDDR